MRKLTLILFVVVTLLAACLAWTQLQLTRLRDENTDLRSRLEDALRQRSRAKMELRTIEKRYADSSTPAATERDVTETAPRTTVPADTPKPTPEATPRRGGRGRGRGFGQRFSRMMQDPKMREAMWNRHRYGLDRQYGSLLKTLNLTPEELTTFKDILTDRRMAWMLAGGEAEDQETRAELVEQRRAELDANLLELLGEEQYEQFENYEQTARERRDVEHLNERLTESAIPLSDSQQDQMVTIMKEEREKLGIEPSQGRRGPGVPHLDTQEEIDAFVDSQKALNENIAARSEAEDVLSNDQLKGLEQQHTERLEGLEAHLRTRLPTGDQPGGG